MKSGLQGKAETSLSDSGIPLVGQVPSHWEAVPIRRLAQRGKDTFTDGDWIESPYITTEGVRLIQTGNIGVREYREQGYRYISPETFDELDCTEVEPGDVLICRLADPVGRACLAPDLDCRMITSVDVCILKTASDVCSRFVVYYLSSDPYLTWLQAICRGGTRDRVSRSQLSAVRVLLPPFSEQQTIASFLDRETAKIDTLIEKKQRLLELLEEKRTALITRAVSRGLDPDVPMKDSGVEWIGEIPEHWDVMPLKFAMKRIADCLHSTPQYEEAGDYPAIRTSDVDSGELDLAGARRVSEAAYRERVQRLVPRPLDILYSREGERYGHAALVPEGVRVCLAQRMMHFRAANDHSPRFLMWALNSRGTYAQASLDTAGATAPHVNVETVRNFQIAVPPFDEQDEIASQLIAETQRLARIHEHVRKAMTLLHEYRTALISAAVTGKIDVCDKVPA